MTESSLPFLSIVVPVFNGQETIGDCIRSILKTDYPAELREILVVDNASTDRTAEIVLRFPVTYVREQRRGRAAARNRGIEESRADIVLFTDADCVVARQWLGQVAASFQTNGVAAVAGEIVPLEPWTLPQRFMALRQRCWQKEALANSFPFFCTANVAFRKHALGRIGLFDPAYVTAEDVDLSWRFFRADLRLSYNPGAVVFHRHRTTLRELLKQQFWLGYGRAMLMTRHRFRSALAYELKCWGGIAHAARRLGRAAWRYPRRKSNSVELTFAWCELLLRLAVRAGTFQWYLHPRRFRELANPVDTRQEASGGTGGDPEGASTAAPLAPRRPPVRTRLTTWWAPRVAAFMLRTDRTPLRPIWAVAHRLVIRGAAALVRRHAREATIYLKGSFASDEPVYGLSDVDLIVVAPGEPGYPGLARRRLQRRWERLCASLPPLRLLIQHFWIYEERDFVESSSAPCLTYGLSGNGTAPPPRAAFFGERPLDDEMGLQDHPGTYDVAREWRRLAGGERRALNGEADPQSRRIAAWLELQYWWGHTFTACADPAPRHIPYLCLKLIAEPVRLWLWLTRGEQVTSRRKALERGLEEIPEERDALHLALQLARDLPHRPRPPLAELLPSFLRLSQKLARHVTAEAAAAGATDVELLWNDAAGLAIDLWVPPPETVGSPDELAQRLLPLADWRACTIPPLPDETFVLVAGDPARPATLARVAAASQSGPYLAFRDGPVLIAPTTDIWHRGRLRSIQCAVTDPVSFALVEGRRTASFADVPGWSARDWARRAVAEHHAWLQAKRRCVPPQAWVGAQPDSRDPTLRTLGLLITAARAALFLESLTDAAPRLPLTAASVLEALSERDGTAAAVAAETAATFGACRLERKAPPASIVNALRDVVRELPAYSSGMTVAAWQP